MRRRDFIGGAAAFAAWSSAARAQSERMRRIGVLVGLARDDPENQARLAALREGLEKYGWWEAHNVRINVRFAHPITLAHNLAKELITLQPDVILAQTTPITAVVKQETQTIPIVFVAVSDPIEAGFVSNLARPDGNLTGLMVVDRTVSGKWLAMLKEISPKLKHVAVMANPKVAFDHWFRAAQAEAPSLDIEIVPGPVENDADIQRLMETLARLPNGGLLVAPDATTTGHRNLIISLLAQYQVPAVFTERIWVEAGGLMSYGVAVLDLFRQSAYYIDRILRGAKPGDLPTQAPTKYETVLNLKTARTLGLVVPESMLVRADKVIE